MNQEYNLSPFHNQNDPMANIPVTPLMIDHLRSTKPWVRLISIVMFVFSAFMILAGFLIMMMPSFPGMSGGGIGALIGILYIVLALLYIVPAYFLHNYASSINQFLRGGGDVAMENALGSQKSFWRFVGILSVVMICLYVLFFIGAIGGSLMALGR